MKIWEKILLAALVFLGGGNVLNFGAALANNNVKGMLWGAIGIAAACVGIAVLVKGHPYD